MYREHEELHRRQAHVYIIDSAMACPGGSNSSGSRSQQGAVPSFEEPSPHKNSAHGAIQTPYRAQLKSQCVRGSHLQVWSLVELIKEYVPSCQPDHFQSSLEPLE